MQMKLLEIQNKYQGMQIHNHTTYCNKKRTDRITYIRAIVDPVTRKERRKGKGEGLGYFIAESAVIGQTLR